MKPLSLVFLFLFLQWKQSAANEKEVFTASLDDTVPYMQIWWDGASTKYEGYNISVNEPRGFEVAVHFSSFSLSGDDDTFSITAFRDDNEEPDKHTFASGNTTTLISLGQVSHVFLTSSGNWGYSKATLIISLYQKGENFTCLNNFEKCPDSCGEKRCVPRLPCSITPLCHHEGENEVCRNDIVKTCKADKTNEEGDNFNWWEVQYLMTILLAGLFFILSPLSIIIFLFYRRKMAAPPVAHLYPQVTVDSAQDSPPTYDDLNDDTKNPPPSFEHATTSATIATSSN